MCKQSENGETLHKQFLQQHLYFNKLMYYTYTFTDINKAL